MSTVTIDKIIIPNACRDVIGVKGVCDETYPYNLDTLGLSLSKIAKLADSASVTAAQLLSDALEHGWTSVFSDLKVQGFKVPGVTRRLKNDFLETTLPIGTYEHEFSRGCEFEQFYFNTVSLKADGEVSVVLTLTYDGTELELLDDTITDETVNIYIDSPFPAEDVTITLVATGSGTLYSTGDHPIKYDGYLECSERLFYCRYHEILVPAVMLKTTAFILNNSIFNDRYNDQQTYKREDAAIRVAQLDSSLNMLNSENRINKYGLYQQEIDKINDKLKAIVNSGCHCGCCFECAEYISSRITIP